MTIPVYKIIDNLKAQQIIDMDMEEIELLEVRRVNEIQRGFR